MNAVSSLGQVIKKVREVESELNERFLERREAIRAILVALVAKQNAVLLGPPGTGKSALVKAVAQYFESKYFETLLAETSTPAQITGPVSVKGLEQDDYRKVTANMIPEANIAFLDEVFNSNGAVLHELHPILNERCFYNGRQGLVPIELDTVIGAANILPQGDNLEAVWDRFQIRLVLDYLKEKSNQARFLDLVIDGGKNIPSQTVTRDELKALQDEVNKIGFPKAMRDKLLELWSAVKSENISISDRRIAQVTKIMRANALLDWRTEVDEDDFGVALHALWNKPDQIKVIKKHLLKLANPYLVKLQSYEDMAIELHRKVMDAKEEEKIDIGRDAVMKLKGLASKIEALKNEAESRGKASQRFDEVLQKVAGFSKEVAKVAFGIEL
mgnify:CR=1 FL=1